MNTPFAKNDTEIQVGQLKDFLGETIALLGIEHVLTDQLRIVEKTKNSLSYSKTVPAIIYPQNSQEVSTIVSLASEHGIKLYAISRGRNIGYGEISPPGDGQVVVSLERMSRIHEFDPQAGEVTLEPGVSQEQLCKFLFDQGDRWIADVTGAPPDSSIVGNALDGGFGHTALGNHREHILEAEAVLGNGNTLRTGRFPGLGPNLAPLLIQSNFGIVTSLRIPLLRKPETIVTFLIHFKSKESFISAIPLIQELRQLGVMQNLLHVANATRIFMSTHRFPPHLSREVVLSDADCQTMMKFSLIKSPLWAGVGALYGTKVQVNESIRILKSRLKGIGKIQTFSDRKFKLMRGVAKFVLWRSPKTLREMIGRIDSLESVHRLCQGIPTERPLEHIHWKVGKKSDLGLIWIGPVIKADEKSALQLIQILKPIFAEFKFEMPITMTFIDHAHLVCILNICFDKSSAEEAERAHRAYKAIDLTLSANNVERYRKGILFQQSGIPEGRLETIRRLKLALDPEGIIAPGRYGICS
ncbi:FAD-binding oxidoreductase [Propionivibrio sp.]|uniref:FAD-binding oxidoreductase n=1 Tax=Propionivibrio sp. TaxID=2212460 RepID=UPI002604B012|nr:FAD-binding oxidoreductase [Propionivibrio sp.]